MPYANNRSADQPVHPCSLISTFVVHCLDSITHILAKSKISSLQLVAVAEQASLCLTWSQMPEDRFCFDVAHMFFWQFIRIKSLLIHLLIKKADLLKFRLVGHCN